VCVCVGGWMLCIVGAWHCGRVSTGWVDMGVCSACVCACLCHAVSYGLCTVCTCVMGGYVEAL